MMRRKNRFLFCVFPILLACPLSGEVFTFKFNTGDKQKIEASIAGKQFRNRKFSFDYSEYFKTIRTVREVNDDGALVEDTYYFYNQSKSEKNKVQEVRNTTVVSYVKNGRGEQKVLDNAFYPTLRNIPVFPATDLAPGAQWKAEGAEIQDMFGDGVISTFPVTVEYAFIGYESVNGRNLAKIRYQYAVKAGNDGKNGIDGRILRADGRLTALMYFDNERGTQVKEEYRREYSFLIADGRDRFTLSFSDSGERIWHDVVALNRTTIVEDIQKAIEAGQIADTEVVQADSGVLIRMENFLFLPDSTRLAPGENDRISKIAGIVSKYRDRGILVVGHTALAGTEEERRVLSRSRAKVIADELIRLGVIDPAGTMILGKGAEDPVADNSTEEGKKLNRRVEILILEE
jgi:outer membrane protein OmpA-like peptidoglycan-associated protein